MHKRLITTRIIVDGVFSRSFEKLRRVYSDKKGEYVNYNRNRYYIRDDSFDLFRHIGKSSTKTDRADSYKIED